MELTGRPGEEGNLWKDKARTPLSPTPWGWFPRCSLNTYFAHPPLSSPQCELLDWPLTCKKSSRNFPKFWRQRTPNSGSYPHLELPPSLNCSPHWSPLVAPSLHDPRSMWSLAILFPPVQKIFSSWPFHNPCSPLDPIQLSQPLGSHLWISWLGIFLLCALEVS